MKAVPSSVLAPLSFRPLQPTQGDTEDQLTLTSLVLCLALPHLSLVEDVSQVHSLPELLSSQTRGGQECMKPRSFPGASAGSGLKHLSVQATL